MKKCLTLVLLIFLNCASVYGQRLQNLLHQNYSDGWQRVAKQASNNQQYKKTSTSQRLKSYSSRYMGQLDSLYFSWSGNRVTEHVAHPFLLYEMSLYDPFWVRTFNPVHPSNRYMLQKPDSVLQLKDIGGTIQVMGAVANTYGASNEIVNHERYGHRSKTSVTYDVNGNITYIHCFVGDMQTGNLIPGMFMQCKYGSNGKLERDSTVDFYYGKRILTHYSYDAAGRDTMILKLVYDAATNTWLPEEKKVMEYSSSNLLTKINSYFHHPGNIYVPSGFFLKEIDSFGYTGIFSYPTFYRHGGSDYSMEYATLNSNGDVEKVTIVNYSSFGGSPRFDTSFRYHFLYNSSNNPITAITDKYDVNNGGWQMAIGTAKYYYDDVTKIHETKATTSLKIFPNPTNDIVNIEVKGAEVSVVFVMDLQGRILQQHSTKGINNLSVDMSDLLKGIYIIKRETAKETAVSKVQKL